MVIDAEVVVTGSFGFTVAADRESVENLLIIHAPTLAARYGENWQAHAAHSVRYSAATTLSCGSEPPGGGKGSRCEATPEGCTRGVHSLLVAACAGWRGVNEADGPFPRRRARSPTARGSRVGTLILRGTSRSLHLRA